VGGPILLGSTGVFIGKKPAARMGDTAACAGPPDMILAGCPTVLIGEIGAGSSASGAASAAAVAASSMAPPQGLEPFDFGPQESPKAEQHEMIFQAEDSAGKPLGGLLYEAKDPLGKTLRAGTIYEGNTIHGGYSSAGSYELKFKALENLTLTPNPCRPGKPLKVRISAPGFEDGERLGFSLVFVTLKTEIHAATVSGLIQGEKAEAEFAWPDGLLEALGKDAIASAYAIAAAGAWVDVSALVKVLANCEGYLQYKGMRIKNLMLSLELCDGEILESRSDAAGKFKFPDIPAGWAQVHVETVAGARSFPVLTEIENPCIIRPRLTVKKLAEKLQAIEAEKGYEEALRCVWGLNYLDVSELAWKWGAEPQLFPDNDPHAMPSRFMILPGATDEGLKAKGNLDEYPYAIPKDDSQEEIRHDMSVANLGILLHGLGFRGMDGEPMWEGDLFESLVSFLKAKQAALQSRGKKHSTTDSATHTVKKGESLSLIAKKCGIPKWEWIYELNRGLIGDNPNLIQPDMELKLPSQEPTPMQKWILEEGYDSHYLDSTGYCYPSPNGKRRIRAVDDNGQVLQQAKIKALESESLKPQEEGWMELPIDLPLDSPLTVELGEYAVNWKQNTEERLV
jgi:hypothetical protein